MKNNESGLKSSFDLAMERMAKRGEKITALTDEQKQAMAEVTTRTKAKIAEIEILYGKKADEARAAGDAGKASKIEEEKRYEIARLREKEESERCRIRPA
ncbi:MAG: hypothetical protein WCI95_04130 [bacterium]